VEKMTTVAGTDLTCLNKFLDKHEIQHILPMLERVHFKKGSVLFLPGSEATEVYFIAKGKFAIQAPTGFQNKMQVVALLSEGSMVGEGGIVGGTVRRATVVAVEESVVLVLRRSDLNEIEMQHPAIAIKIIKHLLVITHGRLIDNSERLAHVL
jgi:CRP-like cAMP-binding protein